MTNQKSVSWKTLNRWFEWIVQIHEFDDYEQEDYYDYVCDLIREKHCKTCKGNFGCNYCSIYAALN